MLIKQDHHDATIIGAGMGGMCAAALMTHQGYKVLVVEKLRQLGGVVVEDVKKTLQAGGSIGRLGSLSDYVV